MHHLIQHWQDIENHLVLPRAEPNDAVPERDEDEAFELEQQRQIDEIRRTIDRFGSISLAIRQAD